MLAAGHTTVTPPAYQFEQSGSSPAPATDKNAKDKQEKQTSDKDKSAKPEPVPESVLTPEQRLTYIIGVEDELQVSVWREPELSTNVVVRPDGMITLPLINDVKAMGLNTE